MKSQTKAMALKAEHFGHKVLALALATALAAPLSLGAMASRAFADEPTGEESTEAPAPADQEATLTIHGIDFMNPTAEDGLWDLFRVDNGEGKNIYIEVEQDGKVIAPRFTYTIVEGQNTDAEKADTDYAGTGDNRIAQIVALKIAQASDAKETPAAQSLQQAFADPAKFPSYTVKVYNAKRQGDMIYQGTVHPVYAKLVADDGTEEWKVLGIRTEGPEGSQDQFADTIGAGTTYYKNIGGDNPVTYQCVNTNEAGDPVVEKAADGKSYVVTYQQVAVDAVSGALKYVDENGAVVDTEIVEDLGTGSTPSNPGTTPTTPGRTTVTSGTPTPTTIDDDADATDFDTTIDDAGVPEAIDDEATPMTAAPTAGDEAIDDDATPMGAFEDDHADCWVHWIMILGIVATAVYGIAVVRRRLGFGDDIDDYEDQIMGRSDVSATTTMPADGRQAL